MPAPLLDSQPAGLDLNLDFTMSMLDVLAHHFND